MLLPDQMSRVLIVGSNLNLEATIEYLYAQEKIHVIDFIDGEEGFAIGKPLPAATKVSERLLKLRSVKKDLEVKEGPVDEALRLSSILPRIEGDDIERLEEEIGGIVSRRNEILQRVSDLAMRKGELRPFVGLPLSLEMYRGYESLVVMAGTTRSDPSNDLGSKVGPFEVFKSSDGRTIAVFVPKDKADVAQSVLSEHGFMEVTLPIGEGAPSDVMASIETEESDLRTELESIDEDLESKKEDYSAFILASDEELSNRVEKAELPLRIGSMGHSFFIDAWIPTAEVDGLSSSLDEEMDGKVFLDVIETKEREEHDHEGEEETRFDVAPTIMNNGKLGSHFEFLVSLISRPKYNEIDPSAIFAWTFPFFFGFMVGDIGYAIPFIVIGAVGLRNCKSDEWRTISTMLFFGGLWAFFFGMFFFAEALGMHFIAHDASELAWNNLLGIQVSHDFGYPWDTYSKLHDVEILLYITCWMGVAHLLIGLLVGMYNVKIRHGMKEAFLEKGGWVLILFGGTFSVLGIASLIELADSPLLIGPMALYAGLLVLIVGLVILMKGEGGTGLLEIFGLMTNVLSYTRLAAIGMSKAGMAFAFNFIAIQMIGSAALPAAILIFLVGHLTIWMLAIMSAGLHSVRLQYVEFFGKFFVGGGLPFNPLKAIRKYTTTTEV